MKLLLVGVPVVALVMSCGSGAPPTTPAGGTSETTRFPLTVENCGRQVTIPQRPEKVRTIGPRMVNQVFAAGAVDRIAGRAGEYGNPPADPAGAAVADVSIVAEEEPSLEAIVGADVDLVIAEGLYNTTADHVSAAGIPVLIMSGFCGQYGQPGTGDATTFTDVYADIELYGRVLGTENQAKQAVVELKKREVAVTKSAQDSPSERPRRSISMVPPFQSTAGRVCHTPS